MPKTQIKCPNCGQPVVAEIQQVFDLTSDPSAKQKLLAGASNIVNCPLCRYQGNLATQIVYHDPDKELLITFSPPEIGLTRDEQERKLGALINRVVNDLPQDKRKGYLLQPKSAFTYEGLVEKILEADGITKEMIDNQQKRLGLIRRLSEISNEEVLKETVKQEEEIIDAEFFGLLSRLIETSAISGDQETSQKLVDLQEKVMPLTEFGRELQTQSQEIEAAIKDLQAIGDGLTREKLLELIINTQNETRLSTIVSLTRPGIDYQFFQLLSEKIDKARGEGRNRLVKLRENLLNLTQEIDKKVEEHVIQVREVIASIAQSSDVKTAMLQALPVVDEYFIRELNTSLEKARNDGDLELIGKYQQMIEVIQQAAQRPPEVQLIEELLSIPEDVNQESGWKSILDQNQDLVTPEFLSTLANIASQAESSDDRELANQLRRLNRVVLRYSMEKQLS